MLASELLPDINLRYRNTFTDTQKYGWMNDEQNDIFNNFKIERDPVPIPLVTGSKLYYRPDELKYIDQVRAATIQINADKDNPVFDDLPYYRDFNNVVAEYSPWYTFLGSDKIYINVPNADLTGRYVYFFLDASPSPIVDGTSQISVPDKYLEILKYGVLRRIAEARKDIVMVSNYANSREELINDFLWKEVTDEPEWITPIDVMPRAGNHGCRWWR
ncbi:hypothetical protein [Paenibacillus sp. XY044]|uniref:phage adaptor protein n=1 Tax=Paenibacillus sp. XY044 TaxID=2026089 RepID=UPI000B9830FF|nr:hypothetical protein [Paenibacillus sp. XY044]OZB90059.1 hypothetical protein CJP46_35360 [Paenibacillus sp. XY044]